MKDKKEGLQQKRKTEEDEALVVFDTYYPMKMQENRKEEAKHMNTKNIAEVVSLKPTEKQVDIIWNITRVCMFSCANCCVDAAHVSRDRNDIIVRHEALRKVVRIPYREHRGTIFDQALVWLQDRGIELNLKGKLRILDHLEGFEAKIDFSGGDPLATWETIPVIREAARRFGKSRITLTATGAGLALWKPDDLLPHIGELNFTYDNVSEGGNAHRVADYAKVNLRKAKEFAAAGIAVRAEFPLSTHNCGEETIRQLYLDLNEAGVQNLLLMRLFPVGRGTLVASDIPSASQYRRAIDMLREMESEYGRPNVKLQCALRSFDMRSLTENPCDLMRLSFGLTAQGILLASPWAIGIFGKPLDDTWILGNLAEQPLEEILGSEKAKSYFIRLNENWGHCKIFSFLNSERTAASERMFDKADPLCAIPSISTPRNRHEMVAV